MYLVSPNNDKAVSRSEDDTDNVMVIESSPTTITKTPTPTATVHPPHPTPPTRTDPHVGWIYNLSKEDENGNE